MSVKTVSPAIALIALVCDVTKFVRAAADKTESTGKVVTPKMGSDKEAPVVSQDMVTNLSCDAFELALTPKQRSEPLLAAIATMCVEFRSYNRLCNKYKADSGLVKAQERVSVATAELEIDAEQKGRLLVLASATKK